MKRAQRGPGVTVLALFDRISVFHTLMPFLLDVHQEPLCARGVPVPRITYTDSAEWCLRRDRNRFLIIERLFLKPPVVHLDLLERLRARYDRIYFLNGNAGGAIHRPEVLPFVDRFYNKAVFRDRSMYGRPLYGTELFTDFAHRRYGVEDDPPWNGEPVPSDQTVKIHFHWNIGVGDFPRHHLQQRAGVALARTFSPRLAAPLIHRTSSFLPPRFAADEAAPGIALSRSRSPGAPDDLSSKGTGTPRAASERSDTPDAPPTGGEYRYDINARLGSPGYPTVAHHRNVMRSALNEAAQERNWSVARDRVPVQRYFDDMQRSRVTFSPFGWGELCFRDFEAIRAGSVLIKPDMGHLETFPDVFVPGETYVPVAWDGSDVAAVVEGLLNDPVRRRRLVSAAAERYRAQLKMVPERAAAMLADLTAS